MLSLTQFAAGSILPGIKNASVLGQLVDNVSGDGTQKEVLARLVARGRLNITGVNGSTFIDAAQASSSLANVYATIGVALEKAGKSVNAITAALVDAKFLAEGVDPADVAGDVYDVFNNKSYAVPSVEVVATVLHNKPVVVKDDDDGLVDEQAEAKADAKQEEAWAKESPYLQPAFRGARWSLHAALKHTGHAESYQTYRAIKHGDAGATATHAAVIQEYGGNLKRAANAFLLREVLKLV